MSSGMGFILVVLAVQVVCGFIVSAIAGKKELDTTKWAIWGFCLGPLALPIVLLAR